MPITPVGSYTDAGVMANTANLNFPAGTMNGDLALWMLCWDTAATVSIGGGPTNQGQHDFNNVHTVAFTKIKQPGDPAGYTLTFSLVADYVQVGTAYRGVNQLTPLDGSPGATDHQTTTNITMSSLSASGTGDMLVCMWAQNTAGGGGAAITADGAMTAEGSASQSGSNIIMTTADQLLAASGATGTRTGTSNRINDSTAYGLLLSSADGEGPGGFTTAMADIRKKRRRRRYLSKWFSGGKHQTYGGPPPASALLAMIASALVQERASGSALVIEEYTASAGTFQG
jgi:hypothetical protein